MPHEPQRARPVIPSTVGMGEKHLNQNQVLGERTHSRSESERTIPSRLLVEGAARVEGLSLGLVHGRPPVVGCVRQIAITCGFAFHVHPRTRFRTATDQKVRGSSPFGRAWSEWVRALGPAFGGLNGSQFSSDRPLIAAGSLSAAARHNALPNRALMDQVAPPVAARACCHRAWSCSPRLTRAVARVWVKRRV